jgi:hypothetical protein
VVDTCNKDTISWVHRRAAGSAEVLPLPAIHWEVARVGERLMQGLQIHDGRQYVMVRYGDGGRAVETSRNEQSPGRLVELGRVLANAKDGIAESVAFVAGLGDEHQGPGRVHYPVPAPGGVVVAWHTGLMGCRRALFDGRVADTARFVVADGLEGRAVGCGATPEEALAAYAAEVSRALPEQRYTVETCNDDYDDDGNLIARGELPPGFADPDAPSAASAFMGEPLEEEREPWQGEAEPGHPPFAPEVDPITGSIDLTGGPVMYRGPKSDAPPIPRRAECVPHVILPLDPSPEDPPSRGRWVRLLGELGVTRHAVRIEERDGFVFVGSDLLGLLDLKGLRAELDRLDAQDPEAPIFLGDHERFVRYRARHYRWRPASGTRPEGLVAGSGPRGPRFEAGSLDGDVLQAEVRRQRRVLRPKD